MLKRIKKLFIKPSNATALQDKHNLKDMSSAVSVSEDQEWMSYEEEARKQFLSLSQKGLSIPVFTA